MDDSSRLWWSLPGPDRFVEQVHASLCSEGCAAIRFPKRRPRDFAPALKETAGRHEAIDVKIIDVSSFNRPDLPSHILGRAMLPTGKTVMSPNARLFANDPGLEDRAVLITGIPDDVFETWDIFLRSFARERKNSSLEVPLAIAAEIPPDAEIPGFQHFRWHGVVDRLDMAFFVSNLMRNRPAAPLRADLFERTVVEIAGFDRDLAERLAKADDNVLLAPYDHLHALVSELGWTNGETSWRDGAENDWDGWRFTHSLALAATEDRTAIERRIWRAHVATLFPWLDDLRLVAIRKWQDLLTTEEDGDFRRANDIEDLEFAAISMQAKRIEAIPKPMVDLLFDLRNMRNALGHRQPVSCDLVLRVASTYRSLLDDAGTKRPSSAT